MVFDPIRVDPHPRNLGTRPPIIAGIHRVVEEKFGPASRTVHFNRRDCRGTNEYAVITPFRNNERTFLDSEAATQLCRKHHGSSPADLARYFIHIWQNSR